ncbi:DUF4097 domain-containing protein [Kitasatospora sp. NBC_01250]|uniref:DUF4097 family beta strand repeat-containing protein n=1 Tax=Kitasatospora sp. NBC_01250 TaxID=2903571 RepID=UPI002E2FEBA9|nr:DUF4097 family beta strand repeat-containing protein [Kitasatospora sp. NBC_01250]
MTAAQQGEPRPQGAERRAWRVVGTLAGAAVILFGAGQTWTSLVRQTSIRPDRYPSTVTALELDLQNASATVTAGGDDQIAVQQAERWTVRQPQISRVVVGNTLKISARCPKVLGIDEPSCSVDLDIGAPASTAVTVRSTSGDTRIRGLSGDLSLRTTSGSFQLDDVSGRLAAQLTSGTLNAQRVSSAQVQAHTTSGSLNLQFVAPPQDLSVTATSGSLTAGLPPGSTYRVNVRGSADTNPALNDSASARSITASVGSGHASLDYTAGG